MTQIIVEFATPQANEFARIWKPQLIELIEKAILSIKPDQDQPPVFNAKDVSVYVTFETHKK